MTKKITYWQDGEFWLGYLNDYPDFVTQGESYEDLIEHLKNILCFHYSNLIGINK